MKSMAERRPIGSPSSASGHGYRRRYGGARSAPYEVFADAGSPSAGYAPADPAPLDKLPISGWDWLKFLGALAGGGLLIFGACWTLITRTDDRITRLEGKVDDGFERMSSSIDRVNSSVSDLRVEVAKSRPSSEAIEAR